MSKIIDLIQDTYSRQGITVSLEFFPAKTEEGVSNLLSRIEVSARHAWGPAIDRPLAYPRRRAVQDMHYRIQPTFVTLTWRSAFKDEVGAASLPS
jgi:5,10-methylenetetrahydrofolate reductase